MNRKVVKLDIPGEDKSAHHSITAAPHVKPAPKTTIKIRSPR
jgi:hypothetical protein